MILHELHGTAHAFARFCQQFPKTYIEEVDTHMTYMIIYIAYYSINYITFIYIYIHFVTV